MASIGSIAGLAVCVALAWAHMIVMAEVLPASEFSAALFGSVLAIIVFWICVAGRKTSHSGLGANLIVPTLVIAVLFAGIQADSFAVLTQHPGTGVLGLAIGLVLGTAMTFSSPMRSMLIFLCSSISFMLVLQNTGIMTAATVLGVCLIVALSLLLFRVGEGRPTVMGGGVQNSGSILFRTSDAILAAILLSADAAVTYLTAWCLALSCSAVFWKLQHALSPQLQTIWKHGSRFEFTAMAARTNLGFLLIGGGGLAFTFVAAQQVLEHTHSNGPAVIAIMIWLLLSYCGPTLMGASELLMQTTGLHIQHRWILGLWGPVALAVVLVIKPTDPVSLAKLVAALQLGYSTHLALMLGLRRGIWPGVTALLQKDLKLT